MDVSKTLANLTIMSESNCMLKMRKEKRQENTVEEVAIVEDAVIHEPNLDLNSKPDPELSSNVFTCTEDGCLATFVKYANLLNHLSHGTHSYSTDTVPMKDRVVLNIHL